MKPLRPIWAIALFNALALLFIPFALEAALTLLDPARGLPPDGYLDGTLYTWGHEVRINRYGFRERDFEIPKPPGTFRVMVLGDSFTYGIGMSTNDRYAGLLEAKLRLALPGRRVEVLTFALPGFSFSAYRAMVGRYLERTDPDAVLVGFCYNDLQPRAQEYSVERERFDHQHPVLSSGFRVFLERHGFPHIGQSLQNGIYRCAEWLGIMPGWMEALDRAYQKHRPEWQAFLEDLKAVRIMLEEKGYNPPIFLALNQFPSPTSQTPRWSERRRYAQWYIQALEAAARAGWRAADCADLIPPEAPSEWFFVNPADQHPSAALHTLYARRAAEMILKQAGGSVKKNERH